MSVYFETAANQGGSVAVGTAQQELRLLGEVIERELSNHSSPTAIQLSNTVVDVLFASGRCLTLPETSPEQQNFKNEDFKSGPKTAKFCWYFVSTGSVLNDRSLSLHG